MENPLSDEATLLRPALVPGMLTMLGHNLNRDVRTVRLFEQGNGVHWLHQRGPRVGEPVAGTHGSRRRRSALSGCGCTVLSN